MKSQLQLLRQIRQQSLAEGVPAALRTARAAVEDGRIALADVPDLFLALRHDDWRYVFPAETATAASPERRSAVAA